MGADRAFTSTDVGEVLARFDAAAIAHWIDGGWGVDALLMRQTRPHGDLDVVMDRNDVPRAQAALAEIGFAHAPHILPGVPARVVLVDDRERQVDLYPVAFDAQRNGWQALGEGAWAQYPAAGVTGSGEVDGHHLGYPWDDHDRRDMTALADRFGLALPPLD
jgi:lincosamide nucleotidyltransferase A/C/D/E